MASYCHLFHGNQCASITCCLNLLVSGSLIRYPKILVVFDHTKVNRDRFRVGGATGTGGLQTVQTDAATTAGKAQTEARTGK